WQGSAANSTGQYRTGCERPETMGDQAEAAAWGTIPSSQEHAGRRAGNGTPNPEGQYRRAGDGKLRGTPSGPRRRPRSPHGQRLGRRGPGGADTTAAGAARRQECQPPNHVGANSQAAAATRNIIRHFAARTGNQCFEARSVEQLEGHTAFELGG